MHTVSYVSLFRCFVSFRRFFAPFSVGAVKLPVPDVAHTGAKAAEATASELAAVHRSALRTN